LTGHAYIPQQPITNSEAPFFVPPFVPMYFPMLPMNQVPIQPMLEMTQTPTIATTGKSTQPKSKVDRRAICQRCGYPRSKHQGKNFGLKKCNMRYCYACSKTYFAHQEQAARLNIMDHSKIMGPNCVFQK
jgi:hypothetical protein